jgi:hypothetical protein
MATNRCAQVTFHFVCLDLHCPISLHFDCTSTLHSCIGIQPLEPPIAAIASNETSY